MEARLARFDAGDPLRALAALSVYVHHVGLWGLFVTGVALGPAATSVAYGAVGGRLIGALDVGLFLFFVLSGYLISRPFARAFVTGAPQPAVRSYVRRRLLRIVPAFWFVVCLILLRHGSLDASAAEIAAIFAFVQTWFHGGMEVELAIGQAWTLHVEMGFYLLVPLTAWALARAAEGRLGEAGRVATVVGAAAAVAAFSLALRHQPPPTLEAIRSLPETVFAFMPGVALAALEVVAPRRLRGARWPRVVAVGLVACSAGLFVAYAWRTTGSQAVAGMLAAGSAATLVAAPLLHQWSGGRAWRVLDNRPLRWLGERSYSVYLVHNAVLWELALVSDSIGRPRTALLVLGSIGLVATIALSALMYRYVERPFLLRRARRRAVPEPAPV